MHIMRLVKKNIEALLIGAVFSALPIACAVLIATIAGRFGLPVWAQMATFAVACLILIVLMLTWLDVRRERRKQQELSDYLSTRY